jgi:microcystin-dependent protein
MSILTPRLNEIETLTPPVGCMMMYVGATAPAGWALCDGATLDRTVHSRLFEIIGTSFGEGDGSTTFHLPDMRGRFPRGVDGGAGRDPNAGTRTASNIGGNTGDNVGSVEGHALQNITGNFSAERLWGGQSAATGALAVGSSPTRQPAGGTTPDTNNLAISFDASRVVSTSTETRPVNINVNYIIKI